MRLPACGLLVLALAACGTSTPPPAPPDAAPAVTATATATASAAPPPAPTATASATASAAPAEPPDAGPPAPPFAADNKIDPTEGPELIERARGLLEAVAKDDPTLGESFWFPEEPFTPLKDVKDANKYWKQLHRTYAADIHKLHKKRKSWDGAKLVSFSGWSRPKWVKPGDEANKIGYHRAFHGKLKYEVGGEHGEIDVHTIITWQGRWYCTHLAKFKK